MLLVSELVKPVKLILLEPATNAVMLSVKDRVQSWANSKLTYDYL